LNSTKIIRNIFTPESKKFWEEAEQNAAIVDAWSDWKRAGINVSEVRSKPRTIKNK
jgi:hypothetical protein